ncbi:hypothetical protein [Anaeromyxobacter oryzae]|uniref:hypothetical protein n=1 Tax=Anaeromyxobacter oryzae TaxID=2918170 RepID=UPI0020C05767|nr:hypothetical protein [Anaeromyxobacter oryzae]
MAGLLMAVAPEIGRAGDWSTGDVGDQLPAPPSVYLLVGGGVTDFTRSVVKDRFGVGGAWDLRLGIGSRSYVGGEVAYVGSFRRGAGADPDLGSSGAEGVLRLQVPYAVRGWLVEPFVFGGIGWSHLSLRNAAPDVKSTDDIGVIPFGGGLTVGYGNLLLDARFTYRSSFSEDLAVAAGPGSKDFSQWGISASVGYEF